MPKKFGNGQRLAAPVLAGIIILAVSVSCASHLKKAKIYYARAGQEEAALRTERAVALYKLARFEASVEAEKDPSIQVFLVKGLAEVNLAMWKEAEASFVKAFALGHDPAQAWASDAALLGLAASFEAIGLDDSAGGVYENLMRNSKFRPAVMTSASKRTEAVLRKSLGLTPKEKGKALSALLRDLDKLIEDDYACGLYHYLASQVCGHSGDHERGYSEAVVARELGLSSEIILRDNDNQLVFCYKKLKDLLPSPEKEEFEARHAAWAARWGWPGPETPDWKKN